MLVFELLGFAKRTATEDGAAFPTGGRTRWTLTLEVARLSAGGSVTVVVEASPTGADDSWSELESFGVQAATGEVERTSTADQSPDFSVTRRDRFFRGRVTAIVGDATCRLSAQAPFLDLVPEDLALVSKELREFADVERVLRRAEEDVLSLVMRQVTAGELGLTRGGAGSTAVSDPDGNPFTPLVVSWLTPLDAEIMAAAPRALAFDADMTLPGFGDAIRAEIARQADHRFRRHRLEQRITEHGVPALLREFPEMVPGLGDLLRPFRPATSTAWRGR